MKTIVAMNICMILFLASCSCERKKEEAFIEKNATSNGMIFNQKQFALVNVLDKEFFDMCHIKGSLNITLDKLENYASENWNKDTTEIVLYCSNYMCTASFAAAQQLTDMGYKNVWAFEGGAAQALHLASQLGFEMQGTNCQASWLLDYEKPATDDQMDHESTVNIISAQELKKKIEKFAAKV